MSATQWRSSYVELAGHASTHFPFVDLIFGHFLSVIVWPQRAVETGGKGGRGHPPELGTSDDPVPTKGSDHAHHITIRPSEFSDLPTALDPRNPAALPRKQLLVCVASCCAAVCVWCWFYRQWLRAAVLTYGTLVKLHLSSLSILYIGLFTYFRYVLRVLGIDLHSVK